MSLRTSFMSEYEAWSSMKQRCYNKNHVSYDDYGGRGIAVCERWLNSFKNFVEDIGKRPDKYTLDRIDNSGDYSPENCKWSSRYEQTQNRRNMRYIEFNGLKFTLKGWAKHLGISNSVLFKRKNAGLPIDKILAPRNKKFDKAFPKKEI